MCHVTLSYSQGLREVNLQIFVLTWLHQWRRNISIWFIDRHVLRWHESDRRQKCRWIDNRTYQKLSSTHFTEIVEWSDFPYFTLLLNFSWNLCFPKQLGFPLEDSSNIYFHMEMDSFSYQLISIFNISIKMSDVYIISFSTIHFPFGWSWWRTVN
jgi:hypothetical protein